VFGESSPDPAELAAELEGAVGQTDLDVIAATTDELALVAALAETVDAAKYWQPPDAEDRALDLPQVHAALVPIARAVTDAPAAQWWSSPIALDRQRYVEWIGDESAPSLSVAAGKLAAWRAATVDDEQAARERPADPSANWSGRWWSTPVLSQLPSTTRALPGLGAVRLAVVEDRLGWIGANCWPLEADRRSTVYEISGPDGWVDLVVRYPLSAID